MVLSVIRQFKWTPTYVLETFYVDNYDFFGLEYWYNEAKLQSENLEKLKNKK